jgi:hypothetical protein
MHCLPLLFFRYISGIMTGYSSANIFMENENKFIADQHEHSDNSEIVVPGVNPDRVAFVSDAQPIQEITNVGGVTGEGTKEIVIEHPAGIRAEVVSGMGGRTFTKVALAATAAAVLATNVGIENKEGGQPPTTEAGEVSRALETVSMETLVNQVRNEVCNVMDVDFMHRFALKNEQGEEEFNPGGFIIPLAVEIAQGCKAKVEVEIHVPYHFARTFREISVKSPEKREEMIAKLAQFINEQVENRLVIHGIAGHTETTHVWDHEHNTLTQGQPRINLGKLDISDLAITGEASTEAEAGKINSGPESMQGVNVENIQLAEKRLAEAMPLITEAFQMAGVDPSVLSKSTQFHYEHNLIDGEIAELANISREVLGNVAVGSDAELAYQLIQEINSGNTQVIKLIESNPAFAASIKEHVTDHRGVTIGFEAETEYQKNEVYNIPIPLPLLLLLLPFIKLHRMPAFTERRSISVATETPMVLSKTMVDMPVPVARRLFSESTPNELDQKRDFHDVYNETNLSAKPEDTRLLLEHMLLEEVLPSLDDTTREPMIDYEKIVNDTREYLHSDTRKGGVEKGSYATPEEAERRMSELLLDMWERHDAETYPMQGIDMKEVLNYRHSPQIVYWAKTLAYHLTGIAEHTTTSEQFREELNSAIAEMRQTRLTSGGSDRNLFVQSALPR